MTEQIIKKRYASLAVFFSLISPGMGHLYVGKWKTAILIPFFLLLIIAFMGWTKLVFLSEGMSNIALIMIVFYLFVMISSFVAARNPSSHNLNTSQKWYLYILFLVVLAVINTAVMDHRGKLFGFEPFRIPASSMLPTMMVNDFMMVDTWAYDNKEPDIGDIIVFDYPRDRKIKYVKRLIGKGGDHIVYSNKVLYINGKVIKRELIGEYSKTAMEYKMDEYNEYLAGRTNKILLTPSRPAIDSEYIVPEGHYFVMGDNRDNSNDSRYWGVFPHDYLHGKVEYIWFSIDNDMNVRSDRMGIRF